MGTARQSGYAVDLAHVHHHHFGHIARAAARTLLPPLRRRHPGGGLVVELGCGSGILARTLTEQGYQVLGLDLSQAMLDIAAVQAPAATFVRASFLDYDLPRCVAVAAVGEVFNYLFDDRNAERRLMGLLRRIHSALVPGGLLLFDVAGPGRAGPEGTRTTRLDHRGQQPPQREHPRRERPDAEHAGGEQPEEAGADDWFLCAHVQEDPSAGTLTREITVFRGAGALYRRADEVHVLRLYPADEVEAHLDQAGFAHQRLSAYDDVAFGPGWTGFLAERAHAPGT